MGMMLLKDSLDWADVMYIVKELPDGHRFSWRGKVYRRVKSCGAKRIR